MSFNILLLVGSLLFLGYLSGKGFIKIGLTGILGYLIIGFVLGSLFKISAPQGFGKTISSLTLSLVGFSIGLNFSLKFLRKMGKEMLVILSVEVIITTLVVFIILFLFTKQLPLSIMLASLSAATAPAGTIAVLREWKTKGPLTDMIIAVVGLDDAAGILMYTLGIALTKAVVGIHGGLIPSLILPVWEITGALILGAAFSFITSFIINRFSFSRDGMFTLFLSLPFIVWGAANFIKASAILSCMVFGAVFINLSPKRGNLAAQIIDNIMSPFYILFFASIGMAIKLSGMKSLWIISILYCIGRSLGKYAGSYLGGVIAKAEEKIKKYLGTALLNQAGVAVGLAYLVSHELPGFPKLSNAILITIALTTAIFQFLAPVGVQYSADKSREGKNPNKEN